MILIKKCIRGYPHFLSNKSKLTICPKMGACGEKKPLGACLIDPSILDTCAPEPRVTIVGAGLAGLSAAHRLTKCGIKNFTVLEATERPGGRIHSCWLNDSVVELGAQWINGACAASPVFSLAVREGLLRPPLSLSNEKDGYFYTTDGRVVNPAISKAATKTFQLIRRSAANLFTSGNKTGKHVSLGELLASQIDKEISRFPGFHQDGALRVINGLANFLRARQGDDLSLVSADQYGSFVSIPGGGVRVPLDHESILTPLIRDIPEGCVKYCTPVKCIMWDVKETMGPRAKVQCFNGEEYACDYVIVTPSLGVLKNTAKQLFSPELPDDKRIAIDKLGYGCMNKIFLEYKKPFWVSRDSTVRLGWSREQLERRSDWSKGITHIEPVAGSKHVLCAWIGGPESAFMETLSEEHVAEIVTSTIRKFTGNPCLPYPSAIKRSTWWTDPYFCGAFSYMGISSTVGHQCELGEPIPRECGDVPPVLLFAGEATSPGYHSTTNGALISGVREADRIIKLTKKYHGPPNSKNLKDT